MEKKHILLKVFCVWLPFAVMATIFAGLAYMLVQQDIRLSANYPQSRIAEDGTTISAPVDIAASLAPFVSTFDANGKLLQSNAVLDGSTPVPPAGVFDYARAHGEDRFTWQPAPNVRIAAVLAYHPATGATPADFVLAGRSLRDVETIESRLGFDTLVIWLVTLFIMLAVSFFIVMIFVKNNNSTQTNP